MTFQVGHLVKWKEVCPIRLGYRASDIGRVVGVHEEDPDDHEIDVEFHDGHVVYGAVEDWFEPVEEAAGLDGEDRD